VQQRQDALVIVLDLSLGMFANDFDPNRITVARRKIMDILDMRHEGQTALIVYAGEAHMVTPLTDDAISIRAMVPALNPNIMPVVGNNPSDAIAMAKNLMDEALTVNGRILLLTGGFTPDHNNAIQDALSGSSYPLNIIGIGSARGAPIPASNGEFLRDTAGQVVVAAMDRDNLNNVATRLGGRYRDISINNSDLDDILSDSLMGGTADYLEAEEQVELWYDAGPWLLLLLVPLCALCFRRGWILQIVIAGGALLLVLPSPEVMAQAAPGEEIDLQEIAIGPQSGAVQQAGQRGFRLSDLWRNRDQRALHSMQQENDPATAATLFEDTSWRGAANYRSGNYEAAVRDFSQGEDLDSKFNLGNALAFAQRFEESIAAYQSVLDIDPENADALKNKEIVESLLQQQQEQEQEQQQQNDEQQPEADDQAEQTEDPSEETEAMENEQQQMDPQQQQQQESEEQQQQQEDQQSDSNNNPNSQQRSTVQVEEDQESLEQFLRRIEDDPGELLQRKFQYEARRRMIERRAASQNAR
jgi:Ca-activated chloride channel family protein